MVEELRYAIDGVSVFDVLNKRGKMALTKADIIQQIRITMAFSQVDMLVKMANILGVPNSLTFNPRCPPAVGIVFSRFV